MKPPPPATAIAATRLLRAWFAILIGLYAGLAVTMVGFAVVTGLMSRDLSTFWVMLLMATMYAMVLGIPVAAISALLALPLLAAQGFIVGPERPYFRPGYIAVALYGPALLTLFTRDWASSGFWVLVIPYEVTVLIATLIYVRLAEPLELFPAAG